MKIGAMTTEERVLLSNKWAYCILAMFEGFLGNAFEGSDHACN